MSWWSDKKEEVKEQTAQEILDEVAEKMNKKFDVGLLESEIKNKLSEEVQLLQVEDSINA